MSRNAIEALLEYLKAIVKDYGDCDEDWYDTKMVSWGYHSLTLGELYQCIQRLEVMDADRQEKRLYKADAEYWQREWEKKHLNNVPDAMLEAEVLFWKEKCAEEKKRRVDASRWARAWKRAAKRHRFQQRTVGMMREALESLTGIIAFARVIDERDKARNWACAWKRAAKHNRSQLRAARTVQGARKSGWECSRVLLDEMVTILEERNEARRWARRLYQAARQAREAIMGLGQFTCSAYEGGESNWREYLSINMPDAYNALCEALAEEE